MVPLYILGGVVVVGIVALVFFRQRWVRADNRESRSREENIERERVEEEDKAEARKSG